MTTQLFVCTSTTMANLCKKSCSKKIVNLSDKDVRKILKGESGDFPTMIPTNDERDNRFINDYQCPVIFDDGSYDLQNHQKMLVVTKFEKTLYYV